SAREQVILQTLSTLIQEAIDLAERRPNLTADGYARRVQEIDNRLENWLLDQYNRWSSLSPDLQRLLKHVANHRDQWLLFLHDPAPRFPISGAGPSSPPFGHLVPACQRGDGAPRSPTCPASLSPASLVAAILLRLGHLFPHHTGIPLHTHAQHFQPTPSASAV